MDFTDPPVLTSRVVTPKYISVGLGSEVPVPKNPSEAQAEPPKRETKEIRLQAVSVSGMQTKAFPNTSGHPTHNNNHNTTWQQGGQQSFSNRAKKLVTPHGGGGSSSCSNSGVVEVVVEVVVAVVVVVVEAVAVAVAAVVVVAATLSDGRILQDA